MEIRFWSNKNFVEDWLNSLDDFNYEFSVSTLGRGHRGVELYVFDKEGEEFIMSKYSTGESKYAKFYLTRSSFTNGSPFYVSIRKL